MGGAAWWVAPSYKVAAVGWRQLRKLAIQVPGAVLRYTERRVDFPSGGWYQVRSADDPDSLRGEGLDRVILDECAFIAEEAWTEALRPSLSDRRGSALFISTPRGHNWFWRAWTRGMGGDWPEWHSWRFPSISNPFLDPSEIVSAATDLPERIYQQEYEAVFLENDGDVFRCVSHCIDLGRSDNELPASDRTYVMGLDLARIADFSVLVVLDHSGKQVYFERFNQISWERQIATIIRVAEAYRAKVFLDSTGVGDPLFEAVRKAGVNVSGYQFTNASKEALIDNLAMRLEAGTIRLMDVPVQANELYAYQYELTPSRNVRMNAPSGSNDDCVIALALAAWGLRTRRDYRLISLS